MHDLDRRKLAAQVGTVLSKDTIIITTMLKPPDSWNKIASFIKRVIKTKEEEREMKRKN